MKGLIRWMIRRLFEWVGFGFVEPAEREYEVIRIDGEDWLIVLPTQFGDVFEVGGEVYRDGDVLMHALTDELMVRRVRGTADGSDVVIGYERLD